MSIMSTAKHHAVDLLFCDLNNATSRMPSKEKLSKEEGCVTYTTHVDGPAYFSPQRKNNSNWGKSAHSTATPPSFESALVMVHFHPSPCKTKTWPRDILGMHLPC